MTKDQKVIRNKVGLLELAKQLGNVSRRARSWGTAVTASIASRSCTTKVQATAEAGAATWHAA